MKTSFESATLSGGRCFFYLEDVTDAEMLPETNSLVSRDTFPERVRVTLDSGSGYMLPGAVYDRLVDRLRSLTTNQQS